MTILRHVTVALFLLLLSGAHAQDSKMTALFIINFAKYIDWEADQLSDNFSIVVLGEDPVEEQLKTLAAEAAVNGKKITITRSATLDKIQSCNILFLSPDQSNQLGVAIDKFSPKRTLVVTAKEGLGKAGAGINIVSVAGKVGFEINAEGLKKAQIKPKPALFKVGKVI